MSVDGQLTGTMGYDLGAPWPGMLTHHSDACPARMGLPCTCGPQGYRGTIEDVHSHTPVLGPVLSTLEEARAWQDEQTAAMRAFQAADRPMDTRTTPLPVADRPVETHGYQAAAQEGTVAAVIDDFLEAALAGEVIDPDGRPYEADQLRDLRWSLRGYVASDLGAMRPSDLGGAELRAFVGRLDAAGLAQTRTQSVVRALRALLRYAAQRGMVPWSAPDQLALGDPGDFPSGDSNGTARTTAHAPTPTPPPAWTPAPQPAWTQAPQPAWTPEPTSGPLPAPTQAPAPSGFVSDEVIWMILKIVTLVFALIALVLVAESV